MINTIGKKTHTLIKENTPCCHKIRQECGFTQKVAFFYISLCFLPHCCVNILVGSLDSYFPTHTKKYMTPTHALIFQKMSKCVFVLDILKSRCKLITLWGSMYSKKKVGWEVIFSEQGFAESGMRKPRWEFEGRTLEPFFLVVLRLNGL